ncbi:MAG: heme-binding protein [Verrucomicrobia bacterium]|nr:heme-binding protein [Verrucomicrobiota bacterium]
MRKLPILALLFVMAPPCVRAQLTLADVQTIIAQAVTRATALTPGKTSTNATIAVTDREGWVLGVWTLSPAPAAINLTNVANAIAKAGTAAFLSSDENAFSSRTAGFIVQQNFPPGVQNKPPGPLVGVNFSQLTFSDINKYKGPGSVIVANATPGFSIVSVPTPITGGLAGTPGGLPLYKSGKLVGGVGVAGDGDGPFDITPQTISSPDVDEDVALAGQQGFAPSPVIFGSHVTIDGIRVAYVSSSTSLGAVTPFGSLPGAAVAPYSPIASPVPFAYPTPTFGGVTGELRQPITADPSAVPLPNGVARLSAAEVTSIIVAGANRARTTRAGIRLPRGRPMQVFITVVNNPNAAGSPPVCLGTFCTSPDTTRFSWDVAVQKARTAVFFSATNRAYSCRTVGFLAESLYPPGIANTTPGLFFGMQERFCIVTTGVSVLATNTVNGAVFNTSAAVNPNLPNGITIFPGGFPIYRDGVLIGAIGVSGDGIDQDDIVSASGASLFPAPAAIRADGMQYRGARLPYAKFPRNPAL